ncbi:MAG: hypothetical protein KJ063_02340 [Anaerolineae bacterium]|nr:hypothetical protein [Anaerolineae bacterium]
MKRVTILLPEDIYELFMTASEQRHESMSNIGRRLVIEWLEANPPKPKQSQDNPYMKSRLPNV